MAQRGSPEWRAKISKTVTERGFHRGRKRPPETGARISAALRAKGIGSSTTKRCPKCEQDLPRADFRTRPNGYTESYCRACSKTDQAQRQESRVLTDEQKAANTQSAREWYKQHPEQAATTRRSNALRRFGLTPESFIELSAAQGDVCAICGTVNANGRRLSIDHNHMTGAIRALLCHPCNVTLGLMKDDPARLRAAADYLDRFA